MFDFKCRSAGAAATLLILATAGAPARADDSELSEVVITATRTPMAIEDIAPPVFVITREQIDESASQASQCTAALGARHDRSCEKVWKLRYRHRGCARSAGWGIP